MRNSTMNIQKLYEDLPQIDTFMNIEMEYEQVEHVLTEYQFSQEYCICIYGLPKNVMDSYLLKICKKAEKYIQMLTENLDKDICWDLEIKPILLFENKECAVLFKTFANLLDEDEFCAFVRKLQLDYNEPWTHVHLITHNELQNILDYQKRRFEYESDSR